MARMLITGSADGLGQMAAQRLVDAGHDVVLHARNRQRAQQVVEAVPKARSVLVGDLASIAEIHAIAEQAHAAGPFDAVIHNAGVGYREPRRETVDGLEHDFAVNVLAPYLLTAPGTEDGFLIIGLVEDKLDDGLSKPILPEAFVPYTVAMTMYTQILVRSDVPPLTLLPLPTPTSNSSSSRRSIAPTATPSTMSSRRSCSSIARVATSMTRKAGPISTGDAESVASYSLRDRPRSTDRSMARSRPPTR